MHYIIVASEEDVDFRFDEDNGFFSVTHNDLVVFHALAFVAAFHFWQGYVAAVRNLKEVSN